MTAPQAEPLTYANDRASRSLRSAKLTRRTVLTTINLPVENDARAHAVFDQHKNEVSNFANLRPAKP